MASVAMRAAGFVVHRAEIDDAAEHLIEPRADVAAVVGGPAVGEKIDALPLVCLE